MVVLDWKLVDQKVALTASNLGHYLVVQMAKKKVGQLVMKLVSRKAGLLAVDLAACWAEKMVDSMVAKLVNWLDSQITLK